MISNANALMMLIAIAIGVIAIGIVIYISRVADANRMDLDDAEEDAEEDETNEFDTPEMVEAVITDIHMPFSSMVVFMVKWSIAAIPAFIILFLIGVGIMSVLISSGLVGK